jgi:hypothetical protein
MGRGIGLVERIGVGFPDIGPGVITTTTAFGSTDIIVPAEVLKIFANRRHLRAIELAFGAMGTA